MQFLERVLEMASRAHVTILFVLAGLLLNRCSSKAEFGGSMPGLVLGENVVYPENEPPSIHFKKGKQTEVISDVDDYPSMVRLEFRRKTKAVDIPSKLHYLKIKINQIEASDRSRKGGTENAGSATRYIA